MLKLHHPAALIAGAVIACFAFIPTRKSQEEISAPNNSNEASNVPNSAPADSKPNPE